jgi:plastocyanin
MGSPVDDATVDDTPPGKAPTGGDAGPWARTAAFGFLLVLVAPLLMIVMSIIDTPNAFALAVSAVIAIVAGVGAWLAASGRRVRLVIAVMLGVLAVLANLGGLAGLGLPGSFWDFAPVVVFLVGSLTAVVAGIAALRRIGVDEATTAGTERRTRQVVLAGVGVVLVASAVLTATGGDKVPDDLRAGALEITADDFAFTPSEVTATAGQLLVITNEDLVYHEFAVDEWGVDVSLLPGDEVLVEVPADATQGAFTFFCSPHTFDGDGMLGTLRIDT